MHRSHNYTHGSKQLAPNEPSIRRIILEPSIRRSILEPSTRRINNNKCAYAGQTE
jgi:hypothetical protein